MPMSERTRPLSLTIQLILVFLLANLCRTLVAMPTSRNFFPDGEERGVGGGGGGGTGSGAIPGRRHESDELHVVRYFRLLNRCSQKYVRLTSKVIDSKGIHNDIYSQLRVVSEEFGSLVRIQSAQTHSFLCFNKRGKLIVKHLGKDRQCIFREIHTPDHFTEYQSAVNDTWFLTFRKTGQAVDAGHDWIRRPGSQRCRQFTKTQFAYLDSADPHHLGQSVRDTSQRPVVNPSGLDYGRVRLGKHSEGQHSETDVRRRTPVEGHQRETSSKRPSVRGHRSETDDQRTSIEGREKEASGKRSPVRGHRPDVERRRPTVRGHQSGAIWKRNFTVTGPQSQDTHQRPPTSPATITRPPVEGHEPEAT